MAVHKYTLSFPFCSVNVQFLVTAMGRRICVIGGGVVGLSCAVRLKEVLGLAADVTLIADKFGKDTTSDVAAGGFRIESTPAVSGYKGQRTDVGK